MFCLMVNLSAVLLTLYRVQGILFSNCKNNKLEIYEDTPAVLTCGDINSNVKVVWKSDPGDIIGECDWNGHCTSDRFLILSRSRQSTESQMTISSDYRRYANVMVTCQEQRSFSTASCTLVILRHSVLSDCKVTINSANWTVSGFCRVREAFSSDNNYSCTWKLTPTQRTFGELSTNRELCSFNQPLESSEGVYNYIISVTPPSTTSFSEEVTIVQPGDITTTCPHWVVSGRDLSCTCQTTNTASPPATVRWEGRDSEKLVKTNVQREDNGTQFTCHVTWAGRVYTSINYTLLVNSTEWVDYGSQPSIHFPYFIVLKAAGTVFVAVVIVLVIIIIIRRRRGKLKEEQDKLESTLQPSDTAIEEDIIVEPSSSDSVASKRNGTRKVFRRSDNYDAIPLREVSASRRMQAAESSCRLSMEPNNSNFHQGGPYAEVKDVDTRPKSSKRHRSRGYVNADRATRKKKTDSVDVVRGKPVLRNQ